MILAMMVYDRYIASAACMYVCACIVVEMADR